MNDLNRNFILFLFSIASVAEMELQNIVFLNFGMKTSASLIQLNQEKKIPIKDVLNITDRIKYEIFINFNDPWSHIVHSQDYYAKFSCKTKPRLIANYYMKICTTLDVLIDTLHR